MSPAPDSILPHLQQTIGDLQRQLAELTAERDEFKAERDEALAQQAANAEVLGVINSSPGDLAPVFDAILEKAHSLCAVTIGALEVWDGERLRALATRGLTTAFEEQIRQGYQPDPNDAHWQLVNGASFVHILDQAAVDDPMHQRAAELTGVRTFLGVALRKDNTLLGRIVAGRQEVRPFAEKEIALLQNFAAQAVIAMENARLLTKTREALKQQTATAEVLGVINSSPGDPTPVFDAILNKALTLCEAAHGHLTVYQDDHFHCAAAQGDPRFVEWFRRRPPHGPGPGTTMEKIVQGASVVQVADVTDDEAYRLGDPVRRALAEIGGSRTAVSVALRKEDTLFGAVTVYRQEVRPFTDKQIALLQNFAAQAVIAMENARLLTETREALEQQTATAEVLGVINSSPGELKPVFDAMLERATRLCEAEYGVLATYDGDRFVGVAAVGFPTDTASALSRLGRPPPDTVLGRLDRTKQTVQMADISQQPSYAAVFEVNPWLRRARTALSVPLLKESALIGAFSMFREEVRPFTDKQVALLQNFAAQAVIAMENARLITETREALEQPTATAEVLQVINSAPGDLTPVFDAILEKAHTLC